MTVTLKLGSRILDVKYEPAIGLAKGFSEIWYDLDHLADVHNILIYTLPQHFLWCYINEPRIQGSRVEQINSLQNWGFYTI